jgi:8-oxo-dGTP pyrophosphatase MutT (NUDIX family)
MKQAYGGVVVDAEGRVLLRLPTGNYGGYAWTFPKGGADPGEPPESAALREVLEETGYEVALVAPIPGAFAGTTSTTRYWLMRPVRAVRTPDPRETAALRWASFDEAPALLAETPSASGRARDLAVLAAARAVYAAHAR